MHERNHIDLQLYSNTLLLKDGKNLKTKIFLFRHNSPSFAVIILYSLLTHVGIRGFVNVIAVLPQCYDTYMKIVP